ncbi:hypothetical protein JXL19_05535 [bacterium]|nr:hypothetical protein [bacterium]
MIREVEYFDQAGQVNTRRCIEITMNMVKSGYHDIVVASTTGEVGSLFARALSGSSNVNLIVVSHSSGFAKKGEQEFTSENRREIESLGGKVLSSTILTHSLETSLASQHSGAYPTIIIAQSLRRLGQGMKVCCEIVMEACDAGLISEGKEVLAVGGTARGADAVCIVGSAASKRFLQLQVKEILAKPREW